jgi:hypothetical protein
MLLNKSILVVNTKVLKPFTTDWRYGPRQQAD